MHHTTARSSRGGFSSYLKVSFDLDVPPTMDVWIAKESLSVLNSNAQAKLETRDDGKIKMYLRSIEGTDTALVGLYSTVKPEIWIEDDSLELGE